MILINLSHPLTEAQQAQIETLIGQPVSRWIEHLAHFAVGQPFAGQLTALVDGLGLSPAEWQGAPLLIVPPALNFATAALLAELHGRCGYFPPVVRLRPVEGSLPPRYEVAEIINLQALRDGARKGRGGGMVNG